MDKYFFLINGIIPVFMNAANDKEILPSVDVFVLPWPKSEQEFGGTNK